MNEEEYLQKLLEEGFKQAPYGWKRVLRGTEVEIVIEPGKDTGMSTPDQLDSNGLRPHPGEKWERVQHLGFADGGDGAEKTLLYSQRALSGELVDVRYGKGDSFYSVMVGPAGIEGYWHVLKNIGSAPIKLRVEWAS